MAALLNPRVWIAVALVALVIFTHFFVYRAGRASLRGEFDAYRVAAEQARATAERQQREIEAQRAAAVTEVQTYAQSQINALAADLAASRTAADGLRAAAADAARRARASACAAASSPGEPDPDPIGVLADVLGRADQRAGVVAEYADRLRIAGIACERSYDALTPVSDFGALTER